MSQENWKKNLLLISIGLALLAAVSAFLSAGDRSAMRNPPDDSRRWAEIRSAADDLDRIAGQAQGVGEFYGAAKASDLTIARRLALALMGTLPSVEELRRFEKMPSEDRLEWYVDYLLEDERSGYYLAERMARVTVGVDEGPFLIFRRRRFVTWLASQIRENRPYDELVQEILTDRGLWTDSPAVNFYTYNIVGDDETNMKPDPVRMAARVSRAFLGMRIDCLQCHDDFLGTMNLGSSTDPVAGTQHHFHALASFFSQTRNSLVGIGDDLDAATYRYQLLEQDEPHVIHPAVPFQAELDDTGQQNLRVRLAAWITSPQNRPFARAIVNRMWAIMFGQGLIDPVDDIPLGGPFPRELEWLVEDFVANGFDLHRLIRLLASTGRFQSESVPVSGIEGSPERSRQAYPLTRLRPEQVAGAIIQSTSLQTIKSTSHVLMRLMKWGQQNDFVSRYGDPGEGEFRVRSETISQRLLLLNGEMVRERLQDGLYSPARIALLAPTPQKTIETVYLAVLTRRPTPVEVDHFTERFSNFGREKRHDMIVDLYWTLINSVEFAWNH